MFGNGGGMPNMNMQGMMYNNPNYNMQMPNMMNTGNFNMMPFFLAMMNSPNMNFQNVGGNEDWEIGYKAGTGENINAGNNNPPSGNKINVIFKTTQGARTTVTMDYGKTMSELIQLYLKRMGKADLFNKRDDICFLFNAHKIAFDCPKKVEDFFQFRDYSIIIVNDANNVIGA